MTRLKRIAPVLFTALLAACQQAPVLNAMLPGEGAVVVKGPVVGGRTLRLTASLAEAVGAYGLLAEASATNASPVHRWVGADVVRYDVELRVRNAVTTSQFDALATPLAAQIPVNAQGAGSASFTQLPAGAYYRAYVKAMGRKGGHAGSDAVVQLNANATGDFADYDFTGNNDVVSALSRSVAVRLDDVAFSGTGALAFGSPLPGGYASPAGALAISPILPPSPSPSPSLTPNPVVQGPFALAGFPIDVATDAQGNVWAVNFTANRVSKLTSNGSSLGSFAVGSNPAAVAVDGQGKAWVANRSSGSVSKLDSDGSALGTFTVGSTPRGLAVDGQGNLWVAHQATSGLVKLASNGSLLGSFLAGEVTYGVAIDGQGNAWVGLATHAVKLNSSGSILASTLLNVLGGGYAGVATDAEGNAWFSNVNREQVHKLASNGSILGAFTAGVQPTDLSLDAQGNAWVLNTSSGQVLKLSSNGSLLATYSVGGQPYGIAISNQGAVWVATGSANTLVVIR